MPIDAVHIEVHVPDVLPVVAHIPPATTYAKVGGAVIGTPGFVEAPSPPEQFVRELNPLPPVTDPPQVPLPPWIPEGPHRKDE